MLAHSAAGRARLRGCHVQTRAAVTRKNQYAEAADYRRRYLAADRQSEWSARARRSLKFCEIQVHLVASA